MTLYITLIFVSLALAIIAVGIFNAGEQKSKEDSNSTGDIGDFEDGWL